MKLRVVVALSLLSALLPGSALACKGPNVIFADDFSTSDPAWGENDDKFIVGDKKMIVKPSPGKGYGGSYQGNFFEDSDICIDVVMPNTKDTGVSGGLLFWFDDWDNYYILEIDGSGSAAIIRWQRGKSLAPVTWRKAPAVKTAPGAVNTLRIVLKGDAGRAFINDQPFATFKGTAPKGGSVIGVFGGSENGASNTWTFTNLKVTNVP